ncbi:MULTISPECIES: ectonucleotide pyrophosphatase/phosphodiesterase [Empedobacter]|uniref:alkaline phosphatase family protein n=1 Tax=Empedobacter TaxID=59734 RepID=UPI0025776772|nr:MULTISPECIES: ectonucleotide pyrophosphatase/phosphodiesterase [Empedobacter]MDM1042099.1 alkaline phosphatase family protein [Empedobacter brevis]MDM1136026.1 alkaline phosphatase family protein [Empedobacter sp. R750]
MKKSILSLFSAIVLTFSITANAQEIEEQIVIENRVNDAKQQDKPYVILISADGFRYDYAQKHEAKNLLALAKNGVKADAMYPSFPSVTFPNHYTIVTGLTPIHHGLVGNNMLDREVGDRYSLGNRNAVINPKWYGGTPIWNLAEQNKMLAACYYWPGSEAPINGMFPTYSYKYSEKSPIDYRIQQVVNWLELPAEKRPHLITFYFPEVDHAGHSFGPDAPETKEAVQFVDQSIKKLNDEVAKTGLKVNFVFVSDHGMTRIDDENPLKLPIKIDESKVQVASNGSYVSLFVKDKNDIESIYKEIKAVQNNTFEVYKTTNVPSKYHFDKKNDRYNRIGDIILIAHSPNYFSNKNAPKGSHGFYVKETLEMKATFMAWGPNIKSGKEIKVFPNTEIYPMLAKILGLPIQEKIDGTNQLANKILVK